MPLFTKITKFVFKFGIAMLCGWQVTTIAKTDVQLAGMVTLLIIGFYILGAMDNK